MNWNSPKIKLLIEAKRHLNNKYNNFCIKLYNYLMGDEVLNDMKEAMAEANSPLNLAANFIPEMDDDFFKRTINLTLSLTLLSLYFSRYPYLFNLLSFQEVKNLFTSQVTFMMMSVGQIKILSMMEELSIKIMEKKVF